MQNKHDSEITVYILMIAIALTFFFAAVTSPNSHAAADYAAPVTESVPN